MFTVVYVFRVPEDKLEAFLGVQKGAEAIYKQYGALDDETLVPVELSARYGCAAFTGLGGADDGERLYVGVRRCRGR